MKNAPSETPATPPAVQPKKKLQLEWIRRASGGAGVALLFVVFSALTSSFYQPAFFFYFMVKS